MKKNMFLFAFLNCILVFSQLDSLQRERLEMQLKIYEEKCTKDSNRALEDSKTKTIYYFSIPAPNGEEFLQEKEFSEILKPHGIIFGGTWMGSDLAGYYTSQQCYYSKMTKLAEDKFGESFFEDKIQLALELFIKNNPDRIFDYRHDDLIFTKNNFEIDLWNKFKLPKNYIRRKENGKFSKIYASFTINKNGKSENVEFETDFINVDNLKFEKQILSSIKNQILNYKWKPNTYKGFAVKSKNFLILTFP